jgi:ATP-dependent helicase YprA (DUF1998 family)
MKKHYTLNNYEKLDYIRNVLDQGYSHAPEECREAARRFVDDIRCDLIFISKIVDAKRCGSYQNWLNL